VVGLQDNGGVNYCGSSGKKDSPAAIKHGKTKISLTPIQR
jgi:hypothetical protein